MVFQRKKEKKKQKQNAAHVHIRHPTTIVVSLGIREQKRQKAETKAEAEKPVRFTLNSSCKRTKGKEAGLDGARVVLKDGKHYLSTEPDPHIDGHPFSGFILPHIDKASVGLVSTVSYDPPMLNWIFIDNNTGELNHGTGSDSKAQLHGDWSLGSEGELLINGKEKFICIKNDKDKWVLYFQDNISSEAKEKTREGRAFFAVKLVMTALEQG